MSSKASRLKLPLPPLPGFLSRALVSRARTYSKMTSRECSRLGEGCPSRCARIVAGNCDRCNGKTPEGGVKSVTSGKLVR